jgi:hypothetical protein
MCRPPSTLYASSGNGLGLLSPFREGFVESIWKNDFHTRHPWGLNDK